jgi:hypothetical protein
VNTDSSTSVDTGSDTSTDTNTSADTNTQEVTDTTVVTAAPTGNADQVYDFESGQLDLVCSGNCPAVSTKYTRSGNFAMESTISNSSRNIKRTEAMIRGSKAKMEYEQDYWIGFSVYLPQGWNVPGKLEILAQIHRSNRSGQPAFALYSGSGEWKAVTNWSGGRETWMLNSVYEDVGRWTDFVIHYKPSDRSTGILEVWKDGALVVQHNGPNTVRDKQGPYLKLGLYKGTYSAPPKSVYHDELRVASGPYAGYSDVAPR